GSGSLQDEARNKLKEWFADGLSDWDISRDAPYFGFEIPGEPGKFFYVWLDAPVGYIASAKNLAEREGLDFDAWWKKDTDTELYHFIGKDILYFHALFWPAMLDGAGFRKPSGVFAHGFLNVNGEKMSKSRGTFISAETYARHLDTDYLRYYFTAKLNSRVEDIDLNMEDFVQRVNSDLVGKLVNIASRTARFVEKRFDGQLGTALADTDQYQRFVDSGEGIASLYEAREYSKAIREIMALADEANTWVNDQQPWIVAKEDGRDDDLQAICTQALNLFRLLALYLVPVVPMLSERSSALLNCHLAEAGGWHSAITPLLAHRIEPFKPLLGRIEMKQIEAIVEDTRAEAAAFVSETAGDSAIEPIADEITIDDFAKLDLRIATVLNCCAIEGSDKLLHFTLDLGDHQRTIFSGIKAAYPEPEALVGRKVVVVANLKPRKMRFGVSEGMILSASGDDALCLLDADDGASAGMRIS
ncbi:methionine--tRNA ligase subunit beta, partial [Gammaproteobacteria bacterium]|nr:methionine--tRNA ligase subunit beta [Gammaproteobacteria bacterium]